jgi:hypothetical protein
MFTAVPDGPYQLLPPFFAGRGPPDLGRNSILVKDILWVESQKDGHRYKW